MARKPILPLDAWVKIDGIQFVNVAHYSMTHRRMSAMIRRSMPFRGRLARCIALPGDVLAFQLGNADADFAEIENLRKTMGKPLVQRKGGRKKKHISDVDANRMIFEERAEAARHCRERLWNQALDVNGTFESRQQAMRKLAALDSATRCKVLEAVGG